MEVYLVLSIGIYLYYIFIFLNFVQKGELVKWIWWAINRYIL